MQESLEQEFGEGSMVGVCDFVAVPIPVRRILDKLGIDSPERIGFWIYTHTLAWSMLSAEELNEKRRVRELVAPSPMGDCAAASMLMAIYSLSKCSPNISYTTRLADWLIKAKGGELTLESSPARSPDLIRDASRHVC